MDKIDLAVLEHDTLDLIAECARLRKENRSLTQQRDMLLARNEACVKQINELIDKLQDMEASL